MTRPVRIPIPYQPRADLQYEVRPSAVYWLANKSWVGGVGFEPTILAAGDFKSPVYTIPPPARAVRGI